MLRGKPLTAVIPVRGGSKGIPGKNLAMVGDQTLLERAIRYAANAPRIDRTLVTTDDATMHAIAGAHGVAAPALRPAELAGDDIRTEDVVLHLVDAAGIAAGYLVLLQVTTPLRALDDLAAACALFESKSEADALVSLCRIGGSHPAKMFTVADDRVAPFLERTYTGPRQALPQVYEPNGAIYIIDIDVLRTERTFVPARTLAFEMPPERSANLDTPQDLQVLTAMLAAGYWSLEPLQ
jgi:CMP-N-acetylneuraminic acid synthetase